MSIHNLFTAWNSKTLTESWWWLREDSTAWKLENKTLKLRTLPGTLWGKNNTAKNVLLRPETAIQSGLTAEVTITNQPILQAEQAGLIWFNDEANYVKLVKENLDNSVWIVLAREQNEVPQLVAKIPSHTHTVRLRLKLNTGTVTGWVQEPENETWQQIGECPLVDQDKVHPGVFTHGGPEDIERWVAFRDFLVYISEDVI